MSPIGLLSVLAIVFLATVAEGRDLKVEVLSGDVQSKDTFNSDPYMSVTVCKEKKRTQTINRTRHPVWNFSHTFRNVNDKCRIKFHLYDDDVVSDDSIGEMEMNLAQYMKEGSGERTLFFGKGKSKVLVKVNYV